MKVMIRKINNVSKKQKNKYNSNYSLYYYYLGVKEM